MSVFVAVLLCLFCSFFHSLEIWPRVEQRKLILATKKTNIITKTTNRQEESPEKKRTRKKRTKPAFFLSFCFFGVFIFFVKPYILCVAGLISLEARSLRFCHSWKRCRSQQKVGVAALTKQRWVRWLPRDKIMEPQMPNSSISPLWILWKGKISGKKQLGIQRKVKFKI